MWRGACGDDGVHVWRGRGVHVWSESACGGMHVGMMECMCGEGGGCMCGGIRGGMAFWK